MQPDGRVMKGMRLEECQFTALGEGWVVLNPDVPP